MTLFVLMREKLMAKAHKDITMSKRKDGAPSPLWPERTRGLNFFRVDHNLQRFLTRYYPVLMQNEEKRLEDLGKFCQHGTRGPGRIFRPDSSPGSNAGSCGPHPPGRKARPRLSERAL